MPTTIETTKQVFLRDIVSYGSRGVSPSYVEENGFVVLNQKCIRRNQISFNDSRLTNNTKKVSKEKFVQQYDVLINSTGVGTLGRLAQFKKLPENLLVDSHIMIIRAKDQYEEIKIDPMYFGYALVERESLIESLGRGATGQTELSKDVLLDTIKIRLPEHKEQKKIAEILGAYDDLIEVNQKKIKILEKLAQSIYKEWFVKPTQNGIPNGWEEKKIRDIYSVKYGKTLPKTLISSTGEYPVYGAGGVIGFYKDGNCFERTTLITSRGNGSGTVWRTQGNGFITNNSFTITSLQNYSYLKFSFIFHSLLNASIISEVTGAAQPQLTIENINYVEILIPKKEMIINFQDKVDYFYNEIDNLYLINKNLQKTRDLLIPQLVGGKISLK